MKKKSGASTIILILILIVGLSLLLYPTVSDYWNSFHQSRAIASYAEEVAHLDETDYSQFWEEALEHNRLLLRNAMILEFQIEIAFSEDVFHLQGIIPGIFIIFIQQILLNTASQASRQRYQTFVVFFQKRDIYSGLSVKTICIGFGNHIAEVFIAFAVFAQQNQMVRIVIDAVSTVAHQSACGINLTADDRLDPGSLCRLIKINAAIHHAVVGDGNGALPKFLDPIHHRINAAGTVQKAIFRMHMQMSKTHITPPSKPAPAFLADGS